MLGDVLNAVARQIEVRLSGPPYMLRIYYHHFLLFFRTLYCTVKCFGFGFAGTAALYMIKVVGNHLLLTGEKLHVSMEIVIVLLWIVVASVMDQGGCSL